MFIYDCRKQGREVGKSDLSVLVVLPIRGADETLADCIAGLAQQDYEHYRVRVIFDSDSDPGWEIADRILDEYPGAPVELVKLSEPHPHCSLKCSAVVEATAELDDAEVVAFLDSDVVPHATWLNELVAPFSDAQVGVTHGNRWYLPEGKYWGSLLRYCWNSATVVTMQMWGMPWGGTLAIRREVLEQSDIRQRWLKAGCEDVPVGMAVKELGKKVHFVPSLIMRDRQEVTVQRCLPFLDRQLLWARLYFPACWWVCSLWQVVIVSVMLVAASCALWGTLSGTWNVAWMGAAGLLVLPVFSIFLMRWVENTLIGSEMSPAMSTPIKVLATIPLTSVLMLRVIYVSLVTQSIDWRGITYRIGGPWDIEMLRYRPYGDEPAGSESPVAGDPSESELAETVSH